MHIRVDHAVAAGNVEETLLQRIAERFDDMMAEPRVRRFVLPKADGIFALDGKFRVQRAEWDRRCAINKGRAAPKPPPNPNCLRSEDFQRFGPEERICLACAHLVLLRIQSFGDLADNRPVRTRHLMYTLVPDVEVLSEMLHVVHTAVAGIPRCEAPVERLTPALRRVWERLTDRFQSAHDLGQRVDPRMTAPAIRQAVRGIRRVLGRDAIGSQSGPDGGIRRGRW